MLFLWMIILLMLFFFIYVMSKYDQNCTFRREAEKEEDNSSYCYFVEMIKKDMSYSDLRLRLYKAALNRGVQSSLPLSRFETNDIISIRTIAHLIVFITIPRLSIQVAPSQRIHHCCNIFDYIIKTSWYFGSQYLPFLLHCKI